MNIVCYLSNGYPNKNSTIENADAYVEGGCDIIEVDLPTNNPYLDNELIQTRMKKSYENDPTLVSQINTIEEIRRKYPEQRLLVLVYEDTVKQLGTRAFADLCIKNSVEAIILVGSTNNDLKDDLINHNVKVASFIPFELPDKEIELAKNSNGFVYLQAKPSGKFREGITTLSQAISFLRKEIGITQPIYCGMGISTREDIVMVESAGGDGAFIGSGLLKKEDDKKEMIQYIKALQKDK